MYIIDISLLDIEARDALNSVRFKDQMTLGLMNKLLPEETKGVRNQSPYSCSLHNKALINI